MIARSRRITSASDEESNSTSRNSGNSRPIAGVGSINLYWSNKPELVYTLVGRCSVRLIGM